jgi:antagonist of KipI
MPVSGAMDRRSLNIANRLVGNHDHEAGIEITLKGPELLFEQDGVIALTGADLTPSVNGTAIPLWTSLLVRAGSRLTFSTRRAGGRCYLAVAGGIDVPVVLGSRATHLSGQIGGMNGRALTTGDHLTCGILTGHRRAPIGRTLPEQLRPAYTNHAMLRILPGPQQDSFVPEVLDLLLTRTSYRLTSESDRMGYRLEGTKIPQEGPGPHISDGTVMGALQIPPDGQPILLMADRQPTGGYPKCAVVISADLHLAGQLLPGDTIRFQTTTLPEAQAAMKAQWNELQRVLPPFRSTAS